MRPIQSTTLDPYTKIEGLLRENPDVFDHRPELLEILQLRHNTGAATSLLERQTVELKNRLQKLRLQHKNLVEVAIENERIVRNFDKVLEMLIGFKSVSEFETVFPAALKQLFSIDEVSLKTAALVEQRSNEASLYDAAVRRLAGKRAICDNRWPEHIHALFFRQKINSAALLPLLSPNKGQVIGLMALGSKSLTRFSNELGTSHLDRLGLMTSVCLHRLQ